MPIQVRLHGVLAMPAGRSRTVPADAGGTLLEILRTAGLAPGTYSILVLNGELVQAQAVPVDGDVVDVYPPLCGGSKPR